MKNGKLPTRNQKILMKSHGLDSEKYLVVKDTQEMMKVVSRSDLKKKQIYGTKPRTKAIQSII